MEIATHRHSPFNLPEAEVVYETKQCNTFSLWMGNIRKDMQLQMRNYKM